MLHLRPIDVSVIIPVYNTGPYLSDCITSIVKQSLTSIEIIIVDDGSTDDSGKIIEQFRRCDPRILFFSQENQGVSTARNFGIDQSSGKYIYFMDSDDILELDTLEKCIKRAESDDLDLLFFDAEVFGSTSTKQFSYKRAHLLKPGIYTGCEVLNILFDINGFSVSPCLNFIKASYIKAQGLFFLPGTIHEDELFTLELFLFADRVSFIDYPFFKRRVRQNSIMTSRFNRRNIDGYLKVLHKIVAIKSDSSSHSEINRLIDRRLASVVPAVLYECRKSKAYDRIYLIKNCLSFFYKYLSFKDLAGVAFPFLAKLRLK